MDINNQFQNNFPQQFNQQNMNGMGMNQMGMNQMGMNPIMNQMGMNPINQMGMNALLMNQIQMNQMGMNQMGMNQQSMVNQQNNAQFFNMNQPMNQQNMQNNNNNQNNQQNSQDYLTVRFIKFDGKNVEISIQCLYSDKVSEVINKYRQKSGDNDMTERFVYNTKNLVPELTVAEQGLINSAVIKVISTKGIKGAFINIK